MFEKIKKYFRNDDSPSDLEQGIVDSNLSKENSVENIRTIHEFLNRKNPSPSYYSMFLEEQPLISSEEEYVQNELYLSDLMEKTVGVPIIGHGTPRGEYMRQKDELSKWMMSGVPSKYSSDRITTTF